MKILLVSIFTLSNQIICIETFLNALSKLINSNIYITVSLCHYTITHLAFFPHPFLFFCNLNHICILTLCEMLSLLLSLHMLLDLLGTQIIFYLYFLNTDFCDSATILILICNKKNLVSNSGPACPWLFQSFHIWINCSAFNSFLIGKK